MGKFLIVVGIVLVALGLLVSAGIPFGRFPGDLVVRRGNFTFYFPIVTSIAISVLLTLLLMFFRR